MKNTIQKKKKEGFTIIEVLIVLAIAGLILLIVFLAVPALQRNQRNNARNAEGARISALVTECIANRNGSNAACGTNAAIGITPGTDTRELGTINYTMTGTVTAPTSGIDTAGVWHGRRCLADGSGVETAANSTARDFAVLFTLEPAITKCISSR